MQDFSFTSMIYFSCAIVGILLPMIVVVKQKNMVVDVLVVFALVSIGFFAVGLLF